MVNATQLSLVKDELGQQELAVCKDVFNQHWSAWVGTFVFGSEEIKQRFADAIQTMSQLVKQPSTKAALDDFAAHMKVAVWKDDHTPGSSRGLAKIHFSTDDDSRALRPFRLCPSRQAIIFINNDSWHAGHLRPKAYGGEDSLANLRPISAAVNHQMNDRHMYCYFLAMGDHATIQRLGLTPEQASADLQAMGALYPHRGDTLLVTLQFTARYHSRRKRRNRYPPLPKYATIPSVATLPCSQWLVEQSEAFYC